MPNPDYSFDGISEVSQEEQERMGPPTIPVSFLCVPKNRPPGHVAQAVEEFGMSFLALLHVLPRIGETVELHDGKTGTVMEVIHRMGDIPLRPASFCYLLPNVVVEFNLE